MNKPKQQFKQTFDAAYNMLNAKQKEGVDQIDGPVMIIAGPGTGKTQLLGVRIGHILQTTDIKAHNILCLTYTEAGMVAMRKRLLKFIGPEAYNVNIYTYHAFCNSIIQENVEYFGGFRELQLVTDLEQLDVLKEIVDGFGDDHILKRWKGNVYYERMRLRNLFSTMKQESWTSEFIIAAVEKELQENLDNGLYDYKRKHTNKNTGETFQKGDLNPKKYDADVKKYEKLKVASKEFDKYQKLLKDRQRFDYNDMILWVIAALKEHEELLARYQEQYQYILVDEYQDTNGSQNELIFQLADFWDKPNLFVVGDDDQAIYRFQGANMENLVDFRNKYEPNEVVLDCNYRSSQKILDPSIELINFNEDRMAVKELIESRNDRKIQHEPILTAYHNPTHESKDIINRILTLKEKGVPLKEIAIIGRKHGNFAEMIQYLEMKGIPVNAKRPVNVLKMPEVQRLLEILMYLRDELDRPNMASRALFRIMHFEYFGLTAMDIGKLSIYCSKKNEDGKYDKRWREVIQKETELAAAGVNDIGGILAFSVLIEDWLKSWINETPQVLFEKILTYGNVLDTIMSSADRSIRLQVVNTFFDFIKNATARSKNLQMEEILKMLVEMEENNLPVNFNNIIYAEDGVNFLTAHGCKGLEFEYVFMIRCDEKNWDGGRSFNSNYSFPGTLTPGSEQSEIEDSRRLFYVAMTRAKNYLQISYTSHTEGDKELNACRYIHELAGGNAEFINRYLEDEEVLIYRSELMRYQQGEVTLLDHNLIDRQLENFSLSVTNLNKYLRCPLTFYFETILRVPMARTASMGFGTAIHFALERHFIKIKTDGLASADKKHLVSSFSNGMDNNHSHFTKEEFDRLSKYGSQILLKYYDQYQDTWSEDIDYHLEYPIKEVHYKGVPINGKLDKVEIEDKQVEVIDFKTGKYKSSSMKPSLGEEDAGGDYWRQLVFYKLLMDSDPRTTWYMSSGTMDFIEPTEEDTFDRKTLVIDPLDEQLVGSQVIETYKKIHNHDFKEGCGEETCKWCNFVKNNFKLDHDLPSHLEEIEEA